MRKLHFSILLALSACTTPSALGPVPGTTGLQSQVAVSLETDVTAIQLTATPINCSTGDATGDAATTDSANLLGQDLADWDFSDDPTVSNTSHDFADVFLLVKPGCYDVDAQPLRSDATASTDCSVAASRGVEVFEGTTTEITLLSTCEGAASGGLDTIVAFNEEPTISDFSYSPSKFTTACEEVTVCAEATDPNEDPVSFEWDVGTATWSVDSNVQNGEITTECIVLTPQDNVDFDIAVTVRDLVADGRTVEQYLADNGIVAESRDALIAPLHVSGPATCSFASCLEALNAGNNTDGLYTLDPMLDGNTVEAYCDMTTDGGGWTRVFGVENSGSTIIGAAASGQSDLNQGLGLAAGGQGHALPSALEIWEATGSFSEIRFECEKDAVGRKVHLQTADPAVLDYYTGTTAVVPVAGSFAALADDNSVLSGFASAVQVGTSTTRSGPSDWGFDTGQFFTGTWGASNMSQTDRQLFDHAIFIGWTAHWIVGNDPSRFYECDDFDRDAGMQRDGYWYVWVR